MSALSRRQGGAISFAQLVGLGIGNDRIHRLVQSGWLVRERRGIYRVGTLTPDGLLWAAALAMGPNSALSHHSSGHEHAVLRGRRPRTVDVTAPTRRRPRGGIRVHTADLDPRDVTVRRGLRFTTVSRTLLDLVATLPEDVLAAARELVAG